MIQVMRDGNPYSVTLLRLDSDYIDAGSIRFFHSAGGETGSHRHHDDTRDAAWEEKGELFLATSLLLLG